MTARSEGQFRTYANYLGAFAKLAGIAPFNFMSPAALTAVAARIRANTIAVGGAPGKLNEVRASLSNAWGTEMIMELARQYANDDELVGLSNNWALVQAYYVLYHATQALLVARGYDRPESHPKTQRMFADMWVTRPAHLEPWSLGVGHGTIHNAPPGPPLDLAIHPWSLVTDQSAWALGAKALYTTRQSECDNAIMRKRQEKKRDRHKAWKIAQDERIAQGRRLLKERPTSLPHLTPDERTAVLENVRPFSLIDFLYRLRITTNYEDATVFVDGPETTADSRLVRRNLSFLTSTSLLLNEIHISLAIGEANLRAWVDDWLTKNLPTGRMIGLALRRPLL